MRLDERLDRRPRDGDKIQCDDKLKRMYELLTAYKISLDKVAF